MRERLIGLLKQAREKCASRSSKDCKNCSGYGKGYECINALIADYLLENGVIVTPCVAMVEQVLKDGKMDRSKTLHYAGKYSVVYVDKSKWKIPLIDITEQCYNDEKALERIQALKSGAE